MNDILVYFTFKYWKNIRLFRLFHVMVIYLDYIIFSYLYIYLIIQYQVLVYIYIYFL